MTFKSYILKIRNFSKYDRLLFVILSAAFLLRFWQLGYSHFYGDETKTFYLDKTVPAVKYFLDQRKGPVQFGVVWVTEKIFGEYDEFYTRLPFAWAGFLSVLVFFLVVQKLFDKKCAIVATSLYSLNGFYIAFSRTIQYQSFLLLFGLLSIYFALLYFETKEKRDIHYVFLSSLFISLAFLCHYDAIFFGVPIVFLIIKKLLAEKDKYRDVLLYFVLPTILIVGIFYVPYYIFGYFNSNTSGYIGNRLIGKNYLTNVSWYTFWVYNPNLLWVCFLFFGLFYFLKQSEWKRNIIVIWFITTFVTFEYIFSNPGTHILNYFIPLIIIVSLGIVDFYNMLRKKMYKTLFTLLFGVMLVLIFTTNLYVYTPIVNKGFPWKDRRINKEIHLYLYGFPYYRAWEQISKYIDERGDVHKIYTNDNDTLAQYYLHGISYTRPGTNYLPEFYIHVEKNQEFLELKNYMNVEDMARYELEKEFFVEGEKVASIYKLVK